VSVAKIEPWQVFRVYLEKARKEKFVITTFKYESLWYCFVINSRLPAFANKPTVLPCFIALPQALHQGFLKYDSYLCVNESFTLAESELTNLVGIINIAQRQKILEGIQICEVLRFKTKHLVLASLKE
jgi:hypothetical protein